MTDERLSAAVGRNEPLPTGSGDGARIAKSTSGVRSTFPGAGRSEDTTVSDPIPNATNAQNKSINPREKN